jgi:hypothetical protein
MTLKQFLKYYALFLLVAGCDSQLKATTSDPNVVTFKTTVCKKMKIDGTTCIICNNWNGTTALSCNWTNDKFKPEADYDEK